MYKSSPDLFLVCLISKVSAETINYTVYSTGKVAGGTMGPWTSCQSITGLNIIVRKSRKKEEKDLNRQKLCSMLPNVSKCKYHTIPLPIHHLSLNLNILSVQHKQIN